jgi:hypothetical protein
VANRDNWHAVATGLSGPLRAVAFSPDARLLAAVSKVGAVGVLEANKSLPHAVDNEFLEGLSFVVFPPGGFFLATASENSACVSEARKMTLPHRHVLHPFTCAAKVFSPDSRRLAVPLVRDGIRQNDVAYNMLPELGSPLAFSPHS